MIAKMAAPSSKRLLPDSSLSTTVLNLVCNLGEISDKNMEVNCVYENDTLNWSVLNTAFPAGNLCGGVCQATVLSVWNLGLRIVKDYSFQISEDSSKLCVPQHTAEWYEKTIVNLAPMVRAISTTMQKQGVNNTQTKQFQWVGGSQLYNKLTELLRSNDLIFAMQLMSSTVERALGNIHSVTGQQVPYLLKDLLNSDTLHDIIGKCPMQLLQVLMGAPVSLNLRNLVWHGFLAPRELSVNYCWFLLAVLIAIADILATKNFSLEKIPQQKLLTLPQIKELIGKFPILTSHQIKKFQTLMHFYHIIPCSMIPCWQAAIQDIILHRYADCVIRLLPQLENILRRLFALANGCGNRALTAQSTEFYTTFDEILAQKVNGEENQFRHVVGDNFLILLYDLLMVPNGPRLRDHLSHGEIDFSCITLDLANYIFLISIIACEISRKYLKHEADLAYDYYEDLFDCVKKYSPVFFPHSICRQQTEKFIKSLEQWGSCMVVKDDVHLTLETLGCSETSSFGETRNQLSGLALKYMNETTFSEMIALIWSLNVSVLYRPQIELEKIGHMSRIAATGFFLSEQIQENVKLQTVKITRREMRSRNRETYYRMIKRLPNIVVGLRIIASVLVEEFLKYDNNQCNNKLFKCLTHYVDNLKVMTSAQKNRWEESEQLTQCFISSLTSIIK